MSEVIRVVAVRLNTTELVMYKEDASTITVHQGDPRIKPLVDKAVPAIERLGYVDISLDELKVHSHYVETEEKTGGVVRFFRAMKRKVQEIVHTFSGEEEKVAAGVIPLPKPTVQTTQAPVPPTEADMVKRSQEVPLTKSQAAVAEIMANAVGTEDPSFHTEVSEESTVVAVLNDGTIIPGMEQLSKQLEATAAGVNSAVGMTNFLNRLAQVKRAHSAQSLLDFIEKGELPIADDGTVLVYKRLKSTTDPKVFVDCHTKTVRQSVGSLVFMHESLVDHNRSTECSNGLHVARRDYLHSFGGDVMVLAKLAPEDVIAVPHGDARKLRSRAYHIIALLSEADAKLAANDQPITDTQLLGNAVAGKHIGVTNLVEILDQKRTAGSVKYSNVEGADYVQEESGRVATSLDLMETQQREASTVDARELGLKTPAPEAVENPPHIPTVTQALEEAAQQKVVKPAKLSVLQQLVKNWENNPSAATAEQLLNYKASAKKSWTALGISAGVVDKVKQAVGLVETPKPAQQLIQAPPGGMKVASKPIGKAKKVPTPAKAKPVVKAQRDTFKAKGKPLPAGKATALSDQQALWEKVKAGNAKAAQELLDLKKAKKKGWTALGLPADAGDVIAKLIK